MNKYMSIITNFGCHYKCPYCVVKENNLHIPRTTLEGLNELENSLKENHCNIISISGGETHYMSMRSISTGIVNFSELCRDIIRCLRIETDLFLWKCTQAI